MPPTKNALSEAERIVRGSPASKTSESIGPRSRDPSVSARSARFSCAKKPTRSIGRPGPSYADLGVICLVGLRTWIGRCASDVEAAKALIRAASDQCDRRIQRERIQDAIREVEHDG